MPEPRGALTTVRHAFLQRNFLYGSYRGSFCRYYKNLKVRGLPISLKSLEGSLTSTAVDVLIYGKALKLIDFKIHYVAGISEK